LVSTASAEAETNAVLFLRTKQTTNRKKQTMEAEIKTYGVDREGKPKKRINYTKQKRYQHAYNKRNKAARKRLGLSIAEFKKLPAATRLMEMHYDPAKPEAKKSWYASLTPEQKKARAEKQKQRRHAREGRRVWECPYCDFSSSGQGAKTRHLKARHPNETGMAEFRPGIPTPEQQRHRQIMQKMRDNGRPETFEDRMIAAVADRIAQAILKGGVE